MTLQYRIRSKYEDRRWQQRVYLFDRLLSEAIDRWCREDAEFPSRSVVATALYLFSPRCEPLELAPYHLSEHFAEVVGTPEQEYHLAWPRRSAAQAIALVGSLSAIIAAAVGSWESRGVGASSSGLLAERLVREIVAQQYVIFHRYETTRRDLNHWGI